MIRLLFIISFCLLLSCRQERDSIFPYPSISDKIDTSFYFPNKFKFNRGDSIVLSSVSESLTQMGQANIAIRPLSVETYRFTYLRAFDETLIITMTKDSMIILKDYNGIEINYKYDDSKLTKQEMKIHNVWGSYQMNKILLDAEIPDSIKARPNVAKAIKRNIRINDSLARLYPLIIDSNYMNQLDEKMKTKYIYHHKQTIKRIPLTIKERETILSSVDKYKFWSMKNTNNLFVGLDGSSWILEANTKDGYYFVYSWEPDGDFKSLCMQFLKYADLKEDKIY
jgi:hypothetical protein